jgi:hypothetical protein
MPENGAEKAAASLVDDRLVGPRPLLPRGQPRNIEIRLMVRPGITGWAQVNGGVLLSPDEKERLDEWYIRNALLWLDLRIAVMTSIPQVNEPLPRRVSVRRLLAPARMATPSKEHVVPAAAILSLRGPPASEGETASDQRAGYRGPRPAPDWLGNAGAAAIRLMSPRSVISRSVGANAASEVVERPPAGPAMPTPGSSANAGARYSDPTVASRQRVRHGIPLRSMPCMRGAQGVAINGTL